MIGKFNIIFLSILFTINAFAVKVATVPGVSRPASIAIDKNQMFIVDGAQILIYSLENFSLQKKFGKSGEGPAEFKINPMRDLSIIVQPDQILVNSIGKLSFFSRDGVFKREMKSLSPLGYYNPLGEKFVGYAITGGENKLLYIAINVYDAELLKGKEIYRFLHPFQPGKDLDPINITRTPILYTCEDKILIDGKDGVIHVFNENGEKIFDITSDKYKKIKLTQAHKDRYINFFKTDYRFKRVYERDKSRIKFPEYFKIIRSYLVVDKKIYVLTYQKENEKSEFFTFSINGKFLKRTMLPLHEVNPLEIYPYTIKENKLYQLLENESGEEWELNVTEIK